MTTSRRDAAGPTQQVHRPEVADYLPLRYTLPLTQLTVKATSGQALDPQIVGPGDPARTLLKGVGELALASTVVPDPRTLYRLELTDEFLGKKMVSIELDQNRIITGINSGVSRDLTPVFEIIKTAVSLAAPRAADAPRSLEDAWASDFPRLSNILQQLTQRLDGLLGALAANDDPETIALIGSAIPPVKAEIAGIDALRRDWIAGHVSSESTSWVWTLQELVRVYRGDAPMGRFPEVLPRISQQEISGKQEDLAKTYGALIAVMDLERTAYLDNVLQPPTDVPRNHVLVRLPRMATLALYRKSPSNVWTLDPTTVQSISVVDDFSDLIEIAFEGEWFREKNQQVVMASDQSIKSWGVTRNSSLGSVITAAAGVITAAGDAYKAKIAEEKPTDDEKAAATAKAKLDLLKTSSELTKLSRGYGLQDELDLADRLVRIADRS